MYMSVGFFSQANEEVVGLIQILVILFSFQ